MNIITHYRVQKYIILLLFCQKKKENSNDYSHWWYLTWSHLYRPHIVIMFYYKVIHTHGRQWIKAETLQQSDFNKSIATTLYCKSRAIILFWKLKGEKLSSLKLSTLDFGVIAMWLLFGVEQGALSVVSTYLHVAAVKTWNNKTLSDPIMLLSDIKNTHTNIDIFLKKVTLNYCSCLSLVINCMTKIYDKRMVSTHIIWN